MPVTSPNKPKADKSQKILAQLSHDLVLVWDVSGKISSVNAQISNVLAYSQAALKKKEFFDLIHEDDKPMVRAALQGLMREEDIKNLTANCEARLVTKGQKTVFVEWRFSKIKGTIYAVGKDISDVRSYEDALERHQRQLIEAEAIGKMGHWYWKIGTQDISWSDEIYKIFGVDKDTFMPNLESVNAMLHARDSGRMIQVFQRAMIEENDYEMDFRVLRPDGQICHVRCDGRCKKDDNGDVIALYGIMQDVTQTMLHESDLREAKDAAERAYAAKSQFLANMSHELRTPLNAIIGFSEMMQRQLLGPIGTEKYLEYIAGIRESGEHLLDIISDILDMSKIEAGKYELDLEEVTVSKVLHMAIQMMENRALEAGVKLSVSMDNEALKIVADRRALMQIMLNLLSNSVKFTKEGGFIKVSCLENQNSIALIIEDNGIGIPANKLQNITNPFEQAASSYTRNHEGSGLGLAITKELAELHGGNLRIESQLDVGTTVTVSLPYDAYATQDMQDNIVDLDDTKQVVNQ